VLRQFVEKKHEDLNEDIDLRAMENGFISVTPLNVHGQVEAEIGAPVSDWLSAVVAEEKEDPSAA
jgi:5'-nucleotidase